MAKKKWPVILGLSVIASVAGSLFFKNKKDQLTDEQLINLEQFYMGHWWFVDQHKKVQHQLEIQEQFRIYIDGKELTGTVVELTRHKLVLRDQYGYHLAVATNDLEPVTLYDEADDITYPLSSKG